MILRPFRDSDFERLYEIDHACFPPGISYSRKEIASYIADPDSQTWVAEESSEIVGFLIAGREGQKSSHIITVDVVEEWRRRGVGAALMNAAEEWARQQGAESIYLETAEDNFAAQQFYQARGYSKIERVEGYYSNGSAAWVMAKGLGRPSATSRQRRRKAGLTS